jgi:hypothetical protein
LVWINASALFSDDKTMDKTREATSVTKTATVNAVPDVLGVSRGLSTLGADEIVCALSCGFIITSFCRKKQVKHFAFDLQV